MRITRSYFCLVLIIGQFLQKLVIQVQQTNLRLVLDLQVYFPEQTERRERRPQGYLIIFYYIQQDINRMLESKIKVKKETLVINDLLQSQEQASNLSKISQIIQKRLFKETINIIYAILINFSTPIHKKLNALTLLKKLFQTAHPDILVQAERIIPVLVQIAVSSNKQKEPGTLYFVLKELRPVDEVERGRKFVRFTLEILKQWAEYMIDVKQSESIFNRYFKACMDQNINFPNFFMYFTMRDYVQFMLNWMKGKKIDGVFQNKLDVFSFLTDPSTYSKKLNFYKNNLSQNAGILVYQTYSILINHSIPVLAKIQVLQSMKDLYQQGNMIYSMKIEELILPYFQFFVNVFESSNPSPERYFEIIQCRLRVDHNHSRQYVISLIQIIKQWNSYHTSNNLNPFYNLWKKLEKKGLLNGESKQIFQPADFNRYSQNIKIGKHREPQYIIPKQPLNHMQNDQKQRIAEYQKKIQEQQQKQNAYKKQIQRLSLLSKQKPMVSSQIVQPVMLDHTFNHKTFVNSQRTSNVLQQFTDPILSIPRSQSKYQSSQKNPRESQITYVNNLNSRRVRDQKMGQKQKQLISKMSRNRVSSRQPSETFRNSETPYNIMSSSRRGRVLSESRYGRGSEFDQSGIHRLSDAIKYMQTKKTQSRLFKQ